MATLFLPAPWRELVNGRMTIDLGDARNLRECLALLAGQQPELADRIWDGERIRSGLSIVVDGAVAHRGLQTPLEPGSEVHILPAIAGG